MQPMPLSGLGKRIAVAAVRNPISAIGVSPVIRTQDTKRRAAMPMSGYPIYGVRLLSGETCQTDTL
jgi:hypothetical protein